MKRDTDTRALRIAYEKTAREMFAKIASVPHPAPPFRYRPCDDMEPIFSAHTNSGYCGACNFAYEQGKAK